MKILVSAYSCEPNKGSESEVGWRWSLKLAEKGHKVFVVTRKNNKKNIQKYLKKKKIKNLNFLYYDLPNALIKLFKKKKNSYLYFYLWQIGIYFFTKNLVKKTKLDYIHHVTFVGLRIPSFLHFHNVPFILGPIAGGDRIKFKLRRSFSILENLYEIIRDISIFYMKFSPTINLSLLRSKIIYVNSKDTYNVIPFIYRKKVKTLLGIAESFKKNITLNKKSKKIFQICYVGRLLHWKGLNISLNVIKNLSKNKKIIFKIAGNGPYSKYIDNFIYKNDLKDIVIKLGHQNKKQLNTLYRNSDLLLFPSLRDSGGYVLLEAASCNLISAVLNVGGPGQIISNSTGININIKDKNEKQIINELTNKVKQILSDKTLMNKKIKKLRYKLRKKFSWDYKYNFVYKNINKHLYN